MKERNRRRSVREICTIPLVLMIMLLPGIVIGCSPKIYQSMHSAARDTTYIERVKIDSIYCRDSIYIREKGDTVFKYVERYRDRFRYLHDTTYIHKIDTLRLTETVIEEVKQPLTKWQSFSIVFGRLCLLLVLLLVGFWAVKKFILKI